MKITVVLGVLLVCGHASGICPEEAKLSGSDTKEYDMFGRLVSIGGNYAIVGSIDLNGNGKAYIFERNAGVWTEKTNLYPPSASSIASVSISGNTAVIGYPKYHAVQPNMAGAAHVFERGLSTWVKTVELLPSDGGITNDFGASVAIDGDYIIVGSPKDSGNSPYSGCAYIFKRDGTTWTRVAKIAASDGQNGENFGNLVSIWDEYVIVGTSRNKSGSAYIFKREGTNWTEQCKLVPSEGEEGDRFGTSIAISGNYAVVGAYGNDDNGEDSGTAYIFAREGTNWVEQVKLAPPDGDASDLFGYSVSISGDYLVVGSVRGDGKQPDSGLAYIYTGGMKQDGKKKQSWQHLMERRTTSSDVQFR